MSATDRPRLRLALKVAWQCWGKPYRWGGDDPSSFDCSGFVQEPLKSAGAFPRKKDMTADGMLNWYQSKGIPGVITSAFGAQPGDLVFFKRHDKAVHVELVVWRDPEGELYSMGASGGGSGTKTAEEAWMQNAYVKVRPVRSVHPSLERVFINPWGVVV